MNGFSTLLVAIEQAIPRAARRWAAPPRADEVVAVAAAQIEIGSRQNCHGDTESARRAAAASTPGGMADNLVAWPMATRPPHP